MSGSDQSPYAGHAREFVLDLDDETWARWDAEAERHGATLEDFVRTSVEQKIERAKAWDGVERRRSARTLLDATGTKLDEHRPR